MSKLNRSRSVLPPRSIADSLKDILDFSDDEFQILSENVSSGKSFFLDESKLEVLSTDLARPEHRITYLISALGFLYERLQEVKLPLIDRQEAIATLIDELQVCRDAPADRSKLEARLNSILSEKPGYDERRKVRRLQSGFLPNGIAFSSFLDMRPVFSSDRDEIDGYTIVMQMRISTDSAKGIERELLFQLNEESLGDLKRAVVDLEKKLNSTKESATLNFKLIS